MIKGTDSNETQLLLPTKKELFHHMNPNDKEIIPQTNRNENEDSVQDSPMF